MAANDAEFDTVDVPEWGTDAKVRVRSLMGDQRARLRKRQDLDDKPDHPNSVWRMMCCAMGMVGENDALLFSNEQEGITVMGRKHPDIVDRIAVKILELSNMTKASRDAAEKKSETTTTSNGGCSSPEPSTAASA